MRRRREGSDDPRLLAALARESRWSQERHVVTTTVGRAGEWLRRTVTALVSRLLWFLATALLHLLEAVPPQVRPVAPRPEADAVVHHEQRRTTTPMGHVVHDRRRVHVPAAGALPLAPEVGAPEPHPAAPPRPSLSGRARAAAAVCAATVISRSSVGRAPVVHDVHAFSELLLTESWPLRVLLRRDATAEQLQEVVRGSGSGAAADWRTAVRRWARDHAAPADLAAVVVEVLTAPSPGGSEVDTALRIARPAVPTFSHRQVVDVLQRCLALATTPVDPYSSSATTLLARDLCVAVMAERPELDKVVEATLQLRRPAPGAGDPGAIPMELELAALALRERKAHSGEAVCRLTAAAGGGSALLMDVAVAADRPLQRPPTLQEVAVPRRLSGLLDGLSRGVWPSLVTVLVVVAAGLLGRSVEDLPAPVSVALAEGVAALAAAATVNVFTVSLAAARLPGVVVGTAGVSGPLVGCYSAATVLIALALWPTTPVLALERKWAAVGAVLAFTVLLLAVMTTFLRRSDPARVVASHTAGRLRTARASGRALGRAQVRSLVLSRDLATVPAVVTSLAPVPGEVGTPVTARRHGLLLPRRSALRGLLASRTFREGTRLRLNHGLGTTVHAGELVATLLPAPHQTVAARTARRTQRTLRATSSADVEDVARSAAALVAFGVHLAADGDAATGARVCSSAVHLVCAHLDAVRSTREAGVRRGGAGPQGRPVDDPTAVVPALKQVLDVAVATHLAGGSGLLDVKDTVVQPLLRTTGRPESAVVLVLAAISRNTSGAGEVRRVASLLRAAGARSVELRDGAVTDQVLDEVRRLGERADGAAEAVAITSEVAAIAARVDPELGRAAVGRVDELLTHLAVSQPRVSDAAAGAFWRVGAAALLAGDLSVAVDVAVRLERRGLLDSVVAASQQKDALDREALWSSLSGGYLGDAALDALADYGRMLSAARSVLTAAP